MPVGRRCLPGKTSLFVELVSYQERDNSLVVWYRKYQSKSYQNDVADPLLCYPRLRLLPRSVYSQTLRACFWMAFVGVMEVQTGIFVVRFSQLVTASTSHLWFCVFLQWNMRDDLRMTRKDGPKNVRSYRKRLFLPASVIGVDWNVFVAHSWILSHFILVLLLQLCQRSHSQG